VSFEKSKGAALRFNLVLFARVHGGGEFKHFKNMVTATEY
jgi:hypothetical protein